MKKVLLLLLLSCFIFAIPCEAKKKPKGEVSVELTPSNSSTTTFRDSIITVDVRTDWSGNFFKVNIHNNTQGRIYVEWENARIDGNKVLFSDDRPITMNQKKEDEVIMVGDMIYGKEITSKGKYYDSLGLLLLYKEKEMSFVLCVRLVLCENGNHARRALRLLHDRNQLLAVVIPSLKPLDGTKESFSMKNSHCRHTTETPTGCQCSGDLKVCKNALR